MAKCRQTETMPAARLTDSDLGAKFRETARGREELTCAQILKFAKLHYVELERMKYIMQMAGVSLKDCEQTCVSLKCEFFK